MKKVKWVLIFLLILFLVLFVVFFMPYIIFFGMIMSDSAPSKEEISDYVNENYALLEDGIKEISALVPEGYDAVDFISDTKVRDYYKDKGVDGLFASFSAIDRPCLYQNISSEILSKIVTGKPAESISIEYTQSGDVLYIEFYCGGTWRNFYCGFYYSPSDLLIDTLSKSVAPDQSSLSYSWHEEAGDNSFYTEKITDSFYYYEERY